MLRRLNFHVFLVVCVVALALFPIACAPSGSGSLSDGTTTGQGTGTGNGSMASGTGGCTGFCGAGGNANGPLMVMPPTATIDVVDGVATPVDFTATAGGVEVNAVWQVDLSSVAGVDAQGLVTATGVAGGKVTVTAKLNNQTATALVTVNLKKTDNPNGFPQDAIDLLRNASTPDPSIVWAYPYDKTVFPKGLLPPELMWNGGGGGDFYRVHLKGTFIDFEFFTAANSPSRFLMDAASWTQLTESGPGGKVDLEVDRLVPGGAAATKLINHQWTIANGSMKGTVYYWSNNLGRVLRIKPGASAPEDFLATAGITNPCSTCHAVSANGSTLVLGGDVGTSTFDLLTNTSAFSVAAVPGKTMRQWAMPAVSPDGNVLIENNAPLPGPPGGGDGSAADGMWDTHTGQHLPGTGLDGVFSTCPRSRPTERRSRSSITAR